MPKPYPSQNKLRMLAERALAIFHAYLQLDPGIASFESTLVPACRAFMDAYDEVQVHEATRNEELADGRAGIRGLYSRIRVWVGVLERDVPGFEASQLQGSPNAPDFLLGDAKRLIELVREREDALPYSDALLQDIEQAQSTAQQEWSEAQRSLAKRVTLQEESRELAAVVQQELVAFRQTLRALLGPSHRDYRKLLVRSHKLVVSDEEVANEQQEQPAETSSNGRSKPLPEAAA